LKIIDCRNVNDAFWQGVNLLENSARVSRKMSRVGEALEFNEPVSTVYHNPMEKVLWSESRAANPFFHFFEAMWMLNGGKDVEFVKTLLPRMAEYSDDGKLMQGAYGFRWREWFDFDQLRTVIQLLNDDPYTRRAVLQMWSPNDLFRITSKDIPCNTSIYFKVRNGRLDMLVSNRSNDMIWGAYGANAVHMAFLMEYVADQVKVPMGVYTQVSDSFHVYTTGPGGRVWDMVRADKDTEDFYIYKLNKGINDPLHITPMRAAEYGWDDDRRMFFSMFEHDVLPCSDDFITFWWKYVVTPYWRAFRLKDPTVLASCKADDWRVAGYRWFKQQKAKEAVK
jgi:thymidylate synthase